MIDSCNITISLSSVAGRKAVVCRPDFGSVSGQASDLVNVGRSHAISGLLDPWLHRLWDVKSDITAAFFHLHPFWTDSETWEIFSR